MLDFCKLHNIKIHYTTPGNSNSNSLVERLHSTLIDSIRVLKLKNPNSAIKQLMIYAIMGYNCSVHSVTKQKPFDIINGRLNALDPFDLTDEIIINKYVNDRKERLKIIYKEIYNQSIKTKTRLNEKQNKNREIPPELDPGKKVFVTDKTASRTKDRPRKKIEHVKQDIGNKIITKKDRVIHKSSIQKPKNFSKNDFLLPRKNEPPDEPRHHPTDDSSDSE